MKMPDLSSADWEVAESLAVNLSNFEVPSSLLKQTLAYLRVHSNQKEISLYQLLKDYLARLRTIGPIFLSGNDSEKQRASFASVTDQLIPSTLSDEKILLILGWAARLMTSNKPGIKFYSQKKRS